LISSSFAASFEGLYGNFLQCLGAAAEDPQDFTEDQCRDQPKRLSAPPTS